MATIKIKFKDVFTSQKSVDIAIDFVSNGTTFNHFILTSKSSRTIVDIQYAFDANNVFVYTYNSSTSEGAKWNLESPNYQYIEIDTNQPNYNKFITALGNNIEIIEDSGTNKLKFGTKTPSKLYMGETEVTKAYMGETLVYEKSQQDELAGTWVVNNTITFNSSIGLPNISSFNFTSNNTLFYGFYFDFNSDGDNSLGYRTNQAYSYVEIYNSRGNIVAGKEVYKTITITSKLSEVTNGNELLTWLQANGVKQ